MKLIDLLVQELPKRGGWPDGAVVAAQDNDGQLLFSSTDGIKWNGYSQWVDGCWIGELPWINSTADDCETSVITRDQYETALAASQKPAWNGGGLPPVGCECEWQDANVGWIPVTIKYISEQIVVIASQTNCCGVQELTEIAKDIICDKPQFRPTRTEADKNRDEAVTVMLSVFGNNAAIGTTSALQAIYDAIAAGKIPGVRLED